MRISRFCYTMQSRVCTLKIDRMPLNLRRKIKGHKSPSMYKEEYESPLIRLASVWIVFYIEKRLLLVKLPRLMSNKLVSNSSCDMKKMLFLALPRIFD